MFVIWPFLRPHQSSPVLLPFHLLCLYHQPWGKRLDGLRAQRIRRSRPEKISKPVADFFAVKTPKAAAPLPKDLPPPPRHNTTDTTDPNEEWLQEERERMRLSRAKLRQVVMHPSNKYHGSVVFAEDDTEDDDSDYDSDNEDEDKTKRYQPTHQTPLGSVLAKYLDSVKDKVTKNTHNIHSSKGQHWIPPDFDAVSLGLRNPVPDRCYTGGCWVYVWLPLVQFPNLMRNKIPCAYCQSTNTESKGLRWRRMFWWDKTVWVLHQRFVCHNKQCCGGCRGCRRHFTSIDPRALSALPTRVAERFEFLTTIGGPGMHRSMMYSFANLVCSQVMFGTFVTMVNKLQKVQCTYETVSYYDALMEWQGESVVGYDGTPKTPYSAFGQAGANSGMLMTTRLLKACTNNFVAVHEQHMQSYCQSDPSPTGTLD